MAVSASAHNAITGHSCMVQQPVVSVPTAANFATVLQKVAVRLSEAPATPTATLRIVARETFSLARTRVRCVQFYAIDVPLRKT